MTTSAAAKSAVSSRHDRALAILSVIFSTAVVVSIVHYADNYFNYEDFPQTSSLPSPSATLVGLSWFGFTALGLAGYELFRHRRYPLACLCLGFYSGSGLVGLGHYAAAGMTSAVWWRQAHVIADIALGIAMLSFAVWAAFRFPARRRASVASGQAAS